MAHLPVNNQAQQVIVALVVFTWAATVLRALRKYTNPVGRRAVQVRVTRVFFLSQPVLETHRCNAFNLNTERICNMDPTSCVESNALLLALEPETEQQAKELVAEMSDGALEYLLKGAQKLLLLVLLERGNRWEGWRPSAVGRA